MRLVNKTLVRMKDYFKTLKKKLIRFYQCDKRLFNKMLGIK